MSVRTRLWLGGGALLLLAWMLLLFFRAPRITYDSQEFGAVRAECGSVVGGSSRGFLLGADGSGLQTDFIDGANLPPTTRAGIHGDCQDRRTTYVGGMALLAVPTTLLAVLAIMSRRRSARSAGLVN
jgi:hypothetical protein